MLVIIGENHFLSIDLNPCLRALPESRVEEGAMAGVVTVQVIVAVVRAVAAMAEEADLGRLLGHLAPVVLVHDGVPVGRQDEELGDHPSPAALSLRAPAAQVRAPRWLLVRRFPHNSLRPGEICREPTQDL